jgi:colanic acid biosynthesis glycosyl transferase WcaI
MLLAVVEALTDVPDLLLLFCGEGPALAPLLLAAAEIDNVRFLPLQPIDGLNDLMGAADIHVLPQRADAEDLVMPSKLTTMMASGRAVVVNASPGSEVARVVEGVGRVVPPGDVAAFAAAIRELAADAALRARLGAAARRRAQALWDAEQVLVQAFGSESLAPLGVPVATPSLLDGPVSRHAAADPISP